MDPNIEAMLTMPTRQRNTLLLQFLSLLSLQHLNPFFQHCQNLKVLSMTKKVVRKHFELHNIRTPDQRKIYLLFCIDLNTYGLLKNLSGKVNVPTHTIDASVEKLSIYFKRFRHVQAARHLFCNYKADCKMYLRCKMSDLCVIA